MNKILVVEDEEPILNLVRISLKEASYECIGTTIGKEAIDLVDHDHFDLAILDIMLPEMNGYEILEYLKPLGIPVIFLTAKSAVKDRVKGLHLGAEDYIIKPFESIELVAIVETVLRRYNKISRYLSVYDIVVDTSSRVVKKNNEIINLTMKEYDLLVLFIRNKNIALFRDSIYENVWHESYLGDSRTVDLHVQRMRKKLGLEDKIIPLYKVGYRLEVEE